jgi:GT2 family glycosyltransferase
MVQVQTEKDFEVIIVDNGSTDDSLRNVKKYDFQLQIVQLATNKGFAVANNIGARLADGKWLALLNVDAFPEPNWLEKLLAATKNYPEYSCFSSRQIQANDPNFLDGAGDVYHVSGLAWRRYFGYPAENYGLEAVEIFSPCAAAAMYLRSAFLEVGGFDEDFFSYFEDVDLGFRLQLRGLRCLYVPDAVVHHVGSVTFGARSDFALYHSQRNLVWTFVKNMPLAMLLRYLPAHVTANLIHLAYYTLLGRGNVVFHAKVDALRDLPRILRKRREVQAHHKTNPVDLRKVMQSGPLEPYLLGKRFGRS